MTRKPTIYEALRAKLGREPTNEELKSAVAHMPDLLSALRALLAIAGTPITERQARVFDHVRATIIEAERQT